ncbi:MAG: Membrane protein insertase YidC [Planctomycetota bacterium]|jgi:YidC/Oxa1 family membrane protein insertase
MNPKLLRFLVTSGLVAVVFIVGSIVARGPGQKANPSTTAPAAGASADAAPDTSRPAADAPAADARTDSGNADAATAGDAAAPVAAPAGTLRARVPSGAAAVSGPASIGSLDPAVAPFRVTFTEGSAGIASIVFSDFWNTDDARRAAIAARKSGDLSALPADDQRFTLVTARDLQGYSVPVLGARAVEVDGALVSLFGAVWTETAPGAFATEIADDAGAAVLRVERRFAASGEYGLVLEQRVENLGASPRTVRLVSYGPGDLVLDPSNYMDMRRFHCGYLLPESRDPSQQFVTANGQMFDRATIASNIADGSVTIWPDRAAADGQYALSWYGVTDRYFTLAVHAPYAPPGEPSRRLSSVAEIRGLSNGLAAPDETLFAEMWSPATPVAAGASAAFDLGVYAGPLDPRVLDVADPYAALNMGDLVVYLMSGCCSWCTFAWLADGMLWFLSFLHDYVVFDWGLAIIALVVVVRGVLHPLQRKSQISMQRFSRAMAAMKPELDQLQKKFKDDPARMQQEQMRLFREKGVSPAGCVGGLLPTFAQMPIWFALYAVLFFAFALRQQPAFFGVFQQVGGWGFLSDLAAPDRFVEFATPIDLGLFTLRSINLLPVLMGLVFWIQQKYMAPPTTPNMTDEQLAQQKMMKWMMVIMFPLMTYAAPSGLTLYIMTSTCVGILEGRAIKRQVDAMDFSKPAPQSKRKQDFLGKMYEKALERAKEKQDAQRKFKKR